MLKKMETAKKKAEAVVDTVDISEREKMSALKRYSTPPTDNAVYSRVSVHAISTFSLATTNEPFSLLLFRLTASTRRRARGRRRSAR